MLRHVGNLLLDNKLVDFRRYLRRLHTLNLCEERARLLFHTKEEGLQPIHHLLLVVGKGCHTTTMIAHMGMLARQYVQLVDVGTSQQAAQQLLSIVIRHLSVDLSVNNACAATPVSKFTWSPNFCGTANSF